MSFDLNQIAHTKRELFCCCCCCCFLLLLFFFFFFFFFFSFSLSLSLSVSLCVSVSLSSVVSSFYYLTLEQCTLSTPSIHSILVRWIESIPNYSQIVIQLNLILLRFWKTASARLARLSEKQPLKISLFFFFFSFSFVRCCCCCC